MRHIVLIAALALPGCSLFEGEDTKDYRRELNEAQAEVEAVEQVEEKAEEKTKEAKAAEEQLRILEVRAGLLEGEKRRLEAELQRAEDENDPNRIASLRSEIQAGNEGRMALAQQVSTARQKAQRSAEDAAAAREEAARQKAFLASLQKEVELLRKRVTAAEKRDSARAGSQGIEAFEGITELGDGLPGVGTAGGIVMALLGLFGVRKWLKGREESSSAELARANRKLEEYRERGIG